MRLRHEVVGAAVLLFAFGCYAAFGFPDAGRALRFLSGGESTGDGMSALVATICWFAIGLMVAATLVHWFGRRWRRLTHLTPGTRAAMVLAAGAITLTLGLLHHQAGYKVCCSTSTSTQRAAQLVH